MSATGFPPATLSSSATTWGESAPSKRRSSRSWAESASSGTELDRLRDVCLDRDVAATGDEKRDPLGLDPAGDETERLDGCLVEQMGIVDADEKRFALGCQGEESECPGVGRKTVSTPSPVADPERPGKRLRM
jgi:hypothetical protein